MYPITLAIGSGIVFASLRLNDQVYNRRIADVQHFVPRDAITCETAACIEINLARAFCIRNTHATTGNRVSEMSVMKVPLMSDRGCERASKNPLMRIFV